MEDEAIVMEYFTSHQEPLWMEVMAVQGLKDVMALITPQVLVKLCGEGQAWWMARWNADMNDQVAQHVMSRKIKDVEVLEVLA